LIAGPPPRPSTRLTKAPVEISNSALLNADFGVERFAGPVSRSLSRAALADMRATSWAYTPVALMTARPATSVTSRASQPAVASLPASVMVAWR
jgi:hypothetical protein